MSKCIKYQKSHESELLSLLKSEPDWDIFTNDKSMDNFKRELLQSETMVCVSDKLICGYIRALVDSFGIYVSELYVARQYRNRGFGRALLKAMRKSLQGQEIYILSDEDLYYQKLGLRRIGSVFQLDEAELVTPKVDDRSSDCSFP